MLFLKGYYTGSFKDLLTQWRAFQQSVGRGEGTGVLSLWSGLWVEKARGTLDAYWGRGVASGVSSWEGPLMLPDSFSKAGSFLPSDELRLNAWLTHKRNSFIWKIPLQGEACQALSAGAWGCLSVLWEVNWIRVEKGFIQSSSKFFLSTHYVLPLF